MGSVRQHRGPPQTTVLHVRIINQQQIARHIGRVRDIPPRCETAGASILTVSPALLFFHWSPTRLITRKNLRFMADLYHTGTASLCHCLLLQANNGPWLTYEEENHTTQAQSSLVPRLVLVTAPAESPQANVLASHCPTIANHLSVKSIFKCIYAFNYTYWWINLYINYFDEEKYFASFDVKRLRICQ